MTHTDSFCNLLWQKYANKSAIWPLSFWHWTRCVMKNIGSIPRMRYGFFFKLTWVMKLSWSRACLCLMLTTGPEMREFCFLLLQALVKKNSCVYLSLCVIIHIQAYGDHTAAVSRINLFVQETPYSWPFYCTQHSFAAAGFYQTWSFVEFGRLFWSACWRTVQLIL